LNCKTILHGGRYVIDFYSSFMKFFGKRTGKIKRKKKRYRGFVNCLGLHAFELISPTFLTFFWVAQHLYMLLTYITYMVLTHVRQIQQGRTYIYIPVEFRDKFKITTNTKVNIENIKGRLIITFQGDEK